MSSAEIKSATSAYEFFKKHVSPEVRAQLKEQGGTADLGSVMKEVSARWNALSPEDAEQYHALADEDRARYNEQCAARDFEVAEEQARKREEREAMDVTGPRSNRAHFGASSDEPARPKKEVSAAEAERRRVKAEAKAQELAKSRAEQKAVENSINTQQSTIKVAIAQQAEARLQYLLKQSDIFSHFGVGKVQADKRKADEAALLLAGGSSEKAPAADAKKRKKAADGSHRRTGDDGSDGDNSDANEEDEELKGNTATTFLTVQPSIIEFGKLRHYQLEGLNWMIRLNANGINGILADEMGLGKTLQSIAVLAYMYEHLGIRGPHIILVPKSTLSNWMNEIARWCPTLRAIRFHGTKDERARLVEEELRPGAKDSERDWDVLVTTYEVANMEKRALQKFAWRYLIIDEAHRLKNEASLFSQTVRSLNMQHRLLLTGTPLQNNLHELWALLNFLLPDVFSSAEQFDEWFNLEIDDNAAKERMIQQLHKILRPFMLRRLKADVEKSLPPKTETILFVGMSSKQKEVYRNVLLRDIDAVNGVNSTGQRQGAILNIVMQLRKCCNHPYLFAGVEDRKLDPLGEHLVQNCGKMVLLSKLLGKLKERGNRVLIFSQMTRMLDILEDFCVMRQYQYCRIDGSTTYEDREDYIDAYNKPDSTKFIFMLSTRAGGLGINLQTADTVILYDSDWNPQADLQAMDRAHRIGQKRIVNVYRFVTENTVEEKVVERAQQKLKMDAMIVQQGRLQDANNKKFSKEELLEALRFGADTVFRSKESSISDADIDAILAAGEKRTKEMEERISKADKGDMLDFSLDGGLETQKFEGVDYSNKANRADAQGLSVIPFHLIDTGKRERKKIHSYKEGEGGLGQGGQASGQKLRRQNKLPKHLRLPKMDEWQFFDRKRLNELYELEEAMYLKAKSEGNLPPVPEGGTLQLLPPDLCAEKALLISQGFSDWTKPHHQLFVRASAKYGRLSHDKIALEVGKSDVEVARYAAAFWSLGATSLSSTDWDRHVKLVERGEKRIEEINRLMDATRAFVSRFVNPWEQLAFQYCTTAQGKAFNAPEDRYLLCLAHQYGYGAWDQVKAAIRRSGRFKFDYFLRSCSADTLGKRCEALMRAAEKENAEWEKRAVAATTTGVSGSRPADSRVLKPGVSKEKAVEDEKRRVEESERIGKLREFVQRLGDDTYQLSDVRSAKQQRKLAELATAPPAIVTGHDGDAQQQQQQQQQPSSSQKGSKREGSTGAGPKLTSPRGGGAKKPSTLPDTVLPTLARIVHQAGPVGVEKLVTKFLFSHPEIAKRQVEKRINEISVKVKREGDARDSWYLKPEFLHYATGGSPLQGDAPDDGESQVQQQQQQPKAAPKKRKAGAAASAAAAAGAADDDAKGGASGSARNPYSWFKEKSREKAVEELRSDGYDAPTAEQVKQKLKDMWNQLDNSVKDEYVDLACKHGFNKKQKV